MRRAIMIVIAPLLALGLAAAVCASEPAQQQQPTDEPAQLSDDGYCKNWCCRRVCNDKNECYQYCWCCG